MARGRGQSGSVYPGVHGPSRLSPYTRKCSEALGGNGPKVANAHMLDGCSNWAVARGPLGLLSWTPARINIGMSDTGTVSTWTFGEYRFLHHISEE